MAKVKDSEATNTEKIKAERKAPERLPYEYECNATRILKDLPEIAKIKSAVITLPGAGILETVFGGNINNDKKILRSLYFGHSKPVTSKGIVIKTFKLDGNPDKVKSIYDAIPASELVKRATPSIKATTETLMNELISNGKVMSLSKDQILGMCKMSLKGVEEEIIKTAIDNAYDTTKATVIKEDIKIEQEEILSEDVSVLAEEDTQVELIPTTVVAEKPVEEVKEDNDSGNVVIDKSKLVDEPSDW